MEGFDLLNHETPNTRIQSSQSLHPTLSTLDLLNLGIGGIIGAGIYVLTGEAASRYAGPGVVFSFIFSGLSCSFSAFCYSELTALMPVAGSAYFH